MNTTWKNHSNIKDIIKILENSENIIVYDTETTGLNKKTDRILQFSASLYSLPEWNKIDAINIFIKCPYSVNELQACKINHITDEILEKEGIEEEEAIDKIYRFMSRSRIISGYNSQTFDDLFMENLYKPYKKTFEYEHNFDVYKLAKNIIPEEFVTHPYVSKDGKISKKPQYKLCYVTEYFDPENKINFHSADSDVDATAFVFENIITYAKNEIQKEIEEEEKRKAIPRQDAKVLQIALFNPSHFLCRAYVNTDQGTIYYDERKKVWSAKTGNINSLNLEYILKQIYDKMGIHSEEEIIPLLKKDPSKKWR